MSVKVILVATILFLGGCAKLPIKTPFERCMEAVAPPSALVSDRLRVAEFCDKRTVGNILRQKVE